MKWISGRDLILIAALLFAALLLLALRPGGDGARFEVLSGGRVVYSGGLDEESEFTVDGVVFSVQNGKIAITESNCPDKTCVRTGYIGLPGQITACLPNRLLARIAGTGGVDAVV